MRLGTSVFSRIFFFHNFFRFIISQLIRGWLAIENFEFSK